MVIRRENIVGGEPQENWANVSASAIVLLGGLTKQGRIS